MLVRRIGELIADQVMITVPVTARVSEAAGLLAQHDVSALIVTHHARMVGILCEQDIEMRCDAEGLSRDTLDVADIMTPDPQTVTLQDSLTSTVVRMNQGGFSHLPVQEPGGDIVGMVTMADIPSAYRMMVERFSAYKSLHDAA